MGELDARFADLRDRAFAELKGRLLPTNIAHEPGGDGDGDDDGDGDLGNGGRPSVPPEAAPGSDPALAAFWNELDWGPVGGGDARAVDFSTEAHPAFCGEGPRASNSGAAAGFGSSRWGSSLNWSGAVLQARAGQRFITAAARWRVPGGRRPEGELLARPQPDIPLRLQALAADEPLPESWRCSVWVGLDGHRLASLSLPQIGTSTIVEVKDGEPRTRTYAWAQWWVRGKMYGEMRFRDFEVAPDDRVTAWLAMLSPTCVLMRILNERTRQVGSALWNSGEVEPGTRFGALVQVHARPAPAEGAAAVFVVERPTVMFGEEHYPLPAMDEVVFERCAAGLRDPADPAWRARLVDLTGARLIRMMRQRADPFRTGTYAVPAIDAARQGLSVGLSVAGRG